MERLLSELDSKLTDNQLSFLCPACPGFPKTHSIVVGFKKGYESAGGDLWDRAGESINDLTVSPSIDATKGHCLFHGWIRGGMVTWQ